MNRIPIRVRLTLPFALAMAVVLAALGAFVYVRVSSTLLRSDRPDPARAGDRGDAPARQGAPAARPGRPRAESASRRCSRAAAPCRSRTRRGCRRSSTRDARHGWWPAAARCARRSSIPGHSGRWRLLAIPRSGERDERARARELARRPGRVARGSPPGAAPRAAAGAAPRDARRLPARRAPRFGRSRRCGARPSAISAATPGSRLPVPPARDEVSRLAETLNEMLERLETAFEHERRFVADASHELRTPLALLRTELELALRHPRSNAELEDAIRSAAEETERLTVARRRPARDRAGRPGEADRCIPRRSRCSELLRGRRAALRGARRGGWAHDRGRGRRRAHRRGRREAGRAGDRQPRRQRARARGGDGDAVRRSPRRAGSSCTSPTRAPGFPAGFAARAFDRFSRADEARPRSGSGLGLAIVRSIAEAHGGEAGVSPDPGASDVWMSLPAGRAAGSRPRATSRASAGLTAATARTPGSCWSRRRRPGCSRSGRSGTPGGAYGSDCDMMYCERLVW